MGNLRLLYLVVYVCRKTARRPRYKNYITTKWKFCSRFINSRLNAQYLPSYLIDRKSYMTFRLVPKSVTLNDLRVNVALPPCYSLSSTCFTGVRLRHVLLLQSNAYEAFYTKRFQLRVTPWNGLCQTFYGKTSYIWSGWHVMFVVIVLYNSQSRSTTSLGRRRLRR